MTSPRLKRVFGGVFLCAACSAPPASPTLVTIDSVDVDVACDATQEEWLVSATVYGDFMSVAEVSVDVSTAAVSETHALQLRYWDQQAGVQEFSAILAIVPRTSDSDGQTAISCNDTLEIAWVVTVEP